MLLSNELGGSSSAHSAWRSVSAGSWSARLLVFGLPCGLGDADRRFAILRVVLAGVFVILARCGMPSRELRHVVVLTGESHGVLWIGAGTRWGTSVVSRVIVVLRGCLPMLGFVMVSRITVGTKILCIKELQICRARYSTDVSNVANMLTEIIDEAKVGHHLFTSTWYGPSLCVD